MAPKKQLRFAMVCASNMNRSMEAHSVLLNAGLSVGSYGVMQRVKLPGERGTGARAGRGAPPFPPLPAPPTAPPRGPPAGPDANSPNVYEFGTPYETIEAELIQKDTRLYTSNGMLEILARNKRVKRAPERWQGQGAVEYDVALTFEMRVMDVLVDDVFRRSGATNRPLLVVNIDVKDNPREAKKAGQEALRLCQALDAAGDRWLDDLERVMDEFYAANERRPVYTVMFV